MSDIDFKAIQNNFDKLNTQIPELKNALTEKIIKSLYPFWSFSERVVDFLVFLNDKEQLTLKEKIDLLNDGKNKEMFKSDLGVLFRNIDGYGSSASFLEIEKLKKINSLFKELGNDNSILEPLKEVLTENLKYKIEYDKNSTCLKSIKKHYWFN